MTGTYLPLRDQDSHYHWSLIVSLMSLMILTSHSPHSHSRHVLRPSFRQVLIRLIKLLEEKTPHLSNSSASDLLGILIVMIMLWGSLYLHNTGPVFGCLSSSEL